MNIARRVLVFSQIFLTLVFASATAWAADTVIGFDDLPADTLVSTQYSSLGVEFIEEGSSTFPTVSSDPRSHSAPNFASIRARGCVAEFCSNLARGRFTNPRQHVLVHVGSFRSTDVATVTLSARDASGIVLASQSVTVSGSDPALVPLEVSVSKN